MRGWYVFWVINFIVAGSTFAGIALIVLVRGIADLRQMFTDLSARSRSSRPPAGQ